MAIVAIDIRVIGKKRTGDETVFLELTKNLIAGERQHQYILLTDRKENDTEDIVKNLNIKSTDTHVTIQTFGPQNKFWWNFFTIPLYLRKHKKIQVFHTQYILPFFLPKTVTVVAHVHDVSFARYPHLIGFIDRFFLSMLIPYTMKRAIIVTPSEFTAQEVKEVYGVAENRVVVVPNAVSEHFLQNLHSAAMSKDDKKDILEKYGIPSKYWLYVGTLQPRKNIPYLLNILAILKERGLEIPLVLVGRRDGHHFDRAIDSTIKELQLEKQVIFPGFVDEQDLPTLYSSAELFLFPSLYEGFGLPIVEALATGARVAVSDIAVHHEVGGKRVTYFPLASIAEAVEILYNLSVQGKQEENFENGFIEPISFSWKASSLILAQVYQQAAEKLN